MSDKKETTEIVKYTYSEEHNAGGFDGLEDNDVVVPFLLQMQGLSSLVTDGKASVGQWLNTLSETLYPLNEGFLFVPGAVQTWVALWEDQQFRGKVPIDDPHFLEMKDRGVPFKEMKNPDGYEMRETKYVYGVVCTEDGDVESPGVIACSKTKLKPFRRWMNSIRRTFPGSKQMPPLYSNLTRVSSKPTKNAKGQPFQLPLFAPAMGTVLSSRLSEEDERFQQAFQVAMLLKQDRVKVDHSKESAAGDVDDEVDSGDSGAAESSAPRGGRKF